MNISINTKTKTLTINQPCNLKELEDFLLMLKIVIKDLDEYNIEGCKQEMPSVTHTISPDYGFHPR